MSCLLIRTWVPALAGSFGIDKESKNASGGKHKCESFPRVGLLFLPMSESGTGISAGWDVTAYMRPQGAVGTAMPGAMARAEGGVPGMPSPGGNAAVRQRCGSWTTLVEYRCSSWRAEFWRGVRTLWWSLRMALPRKSRGCGLFVSASSNYYPLVHDCAGRLSYIVRRDERMPRPSGGWRHFPTFRVGMPFPRRSVGDVDVRRCAVSVDRFVGTAPPSGSDRWATVQGA